LISEKLQPKFNENYDIKEHSDKLEKYIPSLKNRLLNYHMNLAQGADPYFSDYYYHNNSKIYRNPKYNNRKIYDEYNKITKPQLNQKLHDVIKTSLDISLSPNIRKINMSEHYTNETVI
jgi:hypothetical protein